MNDDDAAATIEGNKIHNEHVTIAAAVIYF